MQVSVDFFHFWYNELWQQKVIIFAQCPSLLPMAPSEHFILFSDTCQDDGNGLGFRASSHSKSACVKARRTFLEFLYCTCTCTCICTCLFAYTLCHEVSPPRSGSSLRGLFVHRNKRAIFSPKTFGKIFGKSEIQAPGFLNIFFIWGNGWERNKFWLFDPDINLHFFDFFFFFFLILFFFFHTFRSFLSLFTST